MWLYNTPLFIYHGFYFYILSSSRTCELVLVLAITASKHLYPGTSVQEQVVKNVHVHLYKSMPYYPLMWLYNKHIYQLYKRGPLIHMHTSP